MLSNFFAHLSNAAVSIFAFFVRMNPMWAYRFTKGLKHYEKFLTGEHKEIKVIQTLLKKGVTNEEIKKYSWSKETQIAALANTSFADIFITDMWCEEMFDAAMSNSNQTFHLQACTQRKYTPNERQILEIANSVYYQQNAYWYKDLQKASCFENLIQYHSGTITAKVLNKFTKPTRELFLELAVKYNTATPAQVSWALENYANMGYWEFIKTFIFLMPQDAKHFELLAERSKELRYTLKQWVEAQTAKTLCQCALSYWVKNKDERYLRMIEQKASDENDAESAYQLVTSTRQFDFNDAIRTIWRCKFAKAKVLNYVEPEHRLYNDLVSIILNDATAIIGITERQIEKFSDEHKDLYWKKMAKFGSLTAQQYAALPEGELKNAISKILEDNAQIQLFNTKKSLDIKFFEEKFGNTELSNRVQCWLIEQDLLSWLVIYFSGAHIEKTSQIAFGSTWNIANNRTTHHLSTDAFKMLVDKKQKNVLKAYFSLFNAILPEKREYLLCSPLKELAIGIGVR